MNVRRSRAGFGKSRVRIEFKGPFERQLGVRGLFSEQQRFTDPFEKNTVVGKLILHLGQCAIAPNHERSRMPLHADVDVRDAEIPFLQLR